MSYILDKKKSLIFHKGVRNTLKKLPNSTRNKFLKYFEILELEGYLEYPHMKKITNNIYEIRVKSEGSWRLLYAYLVRDKIVLLHIFQKKSQYLPKKHLKLAQARLILYLK